jgi:hypothetical protein
MVFIFLFPNLSFAQQYCKYGKSKIYSYKNPVYSEESGLFPIGQTLSNREIQFETNGIFGSSIHANPDFIWSSNSLLRYGIFKSIEIQSGVAFQNGPNTYPAYDYNQRYQFILKQGLGEWFKTPKSGVPSSISIRYLYQGSDSVYLTNHHLFGFSINHTFYNPNWRISFALIQFYSKSDFIQTISIKAIRKTNNPYISLFAGYRDNYESYNILQLGVIYSDLKKNRLDISIGRITLAIITINISYSHRI